MVENDKKFGIHWFRRDLRVSGNCALQQLREVHRGRVLGIFFVDAKFLERSDFSHRRFAFFLQTLQELQSDMLAVGSQLLVAAGPPKEGFARVFARLQQRGLKLPSTVSFNRDYEPYARARDHEISKVLSDQGVDVVTASDHLLIEPHEIKKADGGVYQVFTPFSRRWIEVALSANVRERLRAQAGTIGTLRKGSFCLTWNDLFQASCPLDDILEATIKENASSVSIKIPQAGRSAIRRRLDSFRERLDRYDLQRDLPAVKGTSGLSIHFKNGSLTTAQVIQEFDLLNARNASQRRFLTELVWREFYYHVVFHFPQVESEPFHQAYKNLNWENDEKLFAAWKDGRTGYPIVDAGMRQLEQTGWMHNRVRMIVASFLTKDLLIDYRWGERHFMEKLLDGDLAPNNGGWQWSASTGCDPQPYFRVFNPVLQSKKFDGEGVYIRKYVPELAPLSAKNIHEPSEEDCVRLSYPKPIVEHSVRRRMALALYQNASERAKN